MPQIKHSGSPRGGFDDFVNVTDIGDFFPDLLAESGDNPISGMSFEDYVQEIFSKSYPMYSFNVWHIHYICSIVDKLLLQRSNRNLLAALPRYHLKSTILGEGLASYRLLTAFGYGLYLSYKSELAWYHLGNIKEAIRINPIISKYMVDLSPQSDKMIKYRIGSRRMEIEGSGILSMERGKHTDSIMIVDDVQGDIENPMVLNELDKVKRIFNASVMQIPNLGCPTVVFGTAMDYTDLLYTLKDNPNFTSIWLPAINPTPDREILWPERFSKEILEERKATIGWKAFSTEFLLTPLSSSEAYLTREQLEPIINKNIKNYECPGY